MKKYIGCSGFHYKDWEGKFYPEAIDKEAWLHYYSQHFNSVEINNTFYKTPGKETLKAWIQQTPDEFRFSVKGSRYITHMKKLKDSKTHIDKFYRSIDPLSKNLGAVLWQLPANLHRDDEKMETFCKDLDSSFLNVIEFRHSSWFDKEIYNLLSSYGITVCSLSAPDNLPEFLEERTGNIYLRFHGKKEWYNYQYDNKELEKWKDKIEKSVADLAYIYFNNDYNAYAVENCSKMKTMLA
ncbi:MAG: DUF72 domain-containing protein [Bacteroidales bacterium]